MPTPVRPGTVLFVPLVLLVTLLSASPAPAQTAGAPVAAAPGDAAAPPGDAEIRALIATLEDDTRRAELIRNLRALIEASPAPAPEPTVDTLGARLLSYLSNQLEALGDKVGLVAGALGDVPRAIAWFERQAADPDDRERWLAVLLNVVLVLVLGLVARWLIRAAIARPRRAVERRPGDGVASRLALLLVRLVLELVPLAGFVLAAYLALGLTDPDRPVRLVVLTIVNAALLIGVVTAAARLLLAPHVPNLRLFRITDETAVYLYVWVRRLAFTTVLGVFVVEAGLTLGLPLAVRNFLLDVVGLVVALLLVVLVLQNRRSVCDALRGSRRAGALGTLRRRLADIWHVVAIAYVVVLYAIFALNIAGGFGFVLRATVLTVVIALAARLLMHGVEAAVARGFAVPDDLQSRLPDLEARANRYLPVLDRALKAAIVAVAALALLEVWGLGGFDWLATEIGREVVGSALAIALVLAIAVIVWELASNLIERQLTRTDEAGNPVEQSARVRTLLPLLRTALTVTMIVVVGLVVLSELGVNIAPLLAGAGVIGLAVGFGSQALVKDVITGLFILFEDTVSVGDVVEVGGHSGLVEAISIRTIRLRDLSGQVHVVPFSEVSTVKNLTKEFSFYVFDIGVGYREDTDHVIEVVKQLGAELQQDPEYGAVILEPIEIFGVDRFADSAVVIKARFKTRPIKQWMVGREFNRRLKKRFDELGIEIPFPHTTLYFGEDKQGRAPAAHLRLEAPALAEALAGGRAGAAERRPAPGAGNTPEQRGEETPRSTLGDDEESEP